MSFVIGQSDYFRFAFTTLIRKVFFTVQMRLAVMVDHVSYENHVYDLLTTTLQGLSDKSVQPRARAGPGPPPPHFFIVKRKNKKNLSK